MLTEAMTNDGARIELRYVEKMDDLKPGCRCDAVLAFIDDVQVGYLKFDYTTTSIMREEVKTLWQFASHYTGVCFNDAGDKAYSEMTASDIASILRGIKSHSRMAGYHIPGASPQGKVIFDSIDDYLLPYSVMDSDRGELLALLKGCEKTKVADSYRDRRRNYMAFHRKPFVAYVNTTENRARGNVMDHSRRGIGTVLYQAAAIWIVERGLAKGLYGSSNQTDRAQAVWDKFEENGWVSRDGKRRYLDPSRFA